MGYFPEVASTKTGNKSGSSSARELREIRPLNMTAMALYPFSSGGLFVDRYGTGGYPYVELCQGAEY